MSTIKNLIGNTPLYKLNEQFTANKNVTIYLKLEGNNPGGSVKDRAAYNMITSALERGDISPKTKLIEATSGNTGIALAMISGILGFDIELVMPENATKERIQTMKAYGAKVTLTSVEKGIEGARDYAEKKAATGEYFIINQFANDDNWKAHYKTTGPEIWEMTNGEITHFVSAMGTTGTIMGTSRYLKEQNNNIQIVGVQPKEGSRIPGIRRWSPNYIPKIFDPKRVDRIIDVSQEEAKVTANLLAKKQGIFAGMSSGGAVTAAIKLANQIEAGIIVTIICDRGDRYLSSNLFEQN